MRRVLLVTDGSFNALRAARTAADIVRGSQGEIMIVYVIPPVPALAQRAVSKGGADLDDIVTTLRRAMQTGHAALTQAATILAQDGIPYTARLEQGIPADVICQLVRQEQCNTVVIGGSLDHATKLARRELSKHTGACASCSVVIVS